MFQILDLSLEMPVNHKFHSLIFRLMNLIFFGKGVKNRMQICAAGQ